MLPSDAIVAALVAAGVVPAGEAERARALVTPLIPRPVTYNFKQDAEFLHASVEHHVQTYFDQVLEPAALSHLNRATTGGRLMKDGEIQDAAVALTEQVVAELGGPYMEHLDRYFGETGLAAYVYSRIHTRLLDRAARHNDEYLDTLRRRTGGRRTVSASSGKKTE